MNIKNFHFQHKIIKWHSKRLILKLYICYISYIDLTSYLSFTFRATLFQPFQILRSNMLILCLIISCKLN